MRAHPELTHRDIGARADLHFVENRGIIRFVIEKNAVLMKQVGEISGVIVGEEVCTGAPEIPEEALADVFTTNIFAHEGRQVAGHVVAPAGAELLTHLRRPVGVAALVAVDEHSCTDCAGGFLQFGH